MIQTRGMVEAKERKKRNPSQPREGYWSEEIDHHGWRGRSP